MTWRTHLDRRYAESIQPDGKPLLTPKQLIVWQLRTNGWSWKQIAWHEQVAVTTVRSRMEAAELHIHRAKRDEREVA